MSLHKTRLKQYKQMPHTEEYCHIQQAKFDDTFFPENIDQKIFLKALECFCQSQAHHPQHAKDARKYLSQQDWCAAFLKWMESYMPNEYTHGSILLMRLLQFFEVEIKRNIISCGPPSRRFSYIVWKNFLCHYLLVSSAAWAKFDRHIEEMYLLRIGPQSLCHVLEQRMNQLRLFIVQKELEDVLFR